MVEFPSSVRSVRFGVFEVYLRSGELRKKGVKVRLQGQPFVLLITLLKQRGEVVTREELRRALWPEDTFVDFDHSLGTAVNKLREVLGDSAANPRFVETAPRRGYRFIAPVGAVNDVEDTAVSEATSAVEEPATQDQVDIPSATAAAVPLQRPLPWKKVSAFALVLLAAGFLIWMFLPGRPSVLIRSLAVLPLENLSCDPSQDYFLDGMT